MSVPEHLHGALGQKSITASLDTRDQREANRLGPGVIAKIQRRFAEAEAKLANPLAAAATPADVAEGAQDPSTGTHFAAVWDAGRNRYVWAQFVPYMRQAPELVPLPQQDRPVPVANELLRLRPLLEEWKRDTKPAPRTVQEWERAIRLFTEVNGDLPVPAINKKHVREFKRILLSLPSHPSKKDRALPAPEIASRYPNLAEADKLAPATIEKLMRAISTLIEHARRHYDEVTANPFERMIPAAASVKKRRSWTVAALNTLFKSPIFTGCADPKGRERHVPGPHVIRDEWYWLPLLGAFSGARLEELGQLLVTDVKMIDGVWCLAITTLDDEGNAVKRLKTKASKRVVPIHATLRRLGFLDYVADKARSESERLFPNLKPNRHQVLTAKFSRDFGRYRKRVGLGDRWLDFHALRHTFKDRLRAASESDELRDRIMGHATGTVGSGYGEGDPVTKLAEVMARVDYPGLDLSPLRARVPPATGMAAALPSAEAHNRRTPASVTEPAEEPLSADAAAVS